jgi:DNA polymerase (family 10)
MTNGEIVNVLREMAALYEMQSVPFRPRAYEKAAMGVEEADDEMADIFKKAGRKGLLHVPGVGHSIAEHISEMVTTGRLKQYESMKKRLPCDIAGLTQIPGVGPKSVKALYEKLGIRTVKDLEKAAKAGKIASLPHFGKQSEIKILKGIVFHADQAGRYPLGSVYASVGRIRNNLVNSKLFGQVEVCGSFRRMKETVGDIDLLATAQDSAAATKFFVSMDDVAEVLQYGETKSEIRLESGLQVDLRIVPPTSWGAALQYFTGNKAHNIKLRTIAMKNGYKLSEYGLFKGEKQIAGESEEEVYKVLGLEWISPELRTDTGEIEAAAAHSLPEIIGYGDVLGDLQVQTNWTDGRDSIEEMAKAAAKVGRRYIAITDHTKSLAMTRGNDETRLLQQMEAIDTINKKLRSLKILKGAEVNIMKDGSLDIADEVLSQLDVVGIAVHSHFSMPRDEMTGRIVKAMSNPCANILFHPTTRIVNQRPAIDFDFETVLRIARQHRVALEINAHPYRLDLHDSLIRQAIDAGVKLVIDTDAHAVGELAFMHFGEAQARRGWATRSDILNTQPFDKILQFFKG